MICPICGNEFEPKVSNQKYCSPMCGMKAANLRNHPKVSNYQKDLRVDLRRRVYDLLGDKCVFCGEDDPIVLTVDHIEPCGKNRKITLGVYYEILKNPTDAKKNYQLLCRNCNWRKMIQNNERALEDKPFAYKWELEALYAIIEELKSKFKEDMHSVNQKSLSNADLEEIVYKELKNEILNESTNKIDEIRIMTALEESKGIHVSQWKARQIRKRLEMHYPNEFEK